MPSSPTGTITFLFTDIEESTRHWDEQPEAMKAALARHDAILRSSIEAHGGHVFKTVGDAFYAAFPVASEGLKAAVKAQHALAAESWGETGPLRVRMALHTGSAQQRENDYFGPPLNRVARLLGAGHGGQMLLSHAMEELVRDHLPGGTQLRDLGSHRLRDLIHPEQIFQVVAPPLPTDFPALKTLDARPNNLQTQPTLLLGRSEEVKQICARFRDEDVRLLTLTGPGGTGKTRLGLQVAADLLDDYKDGVYFVALAPLSDPKLVASTIAQTLGLKEAGGRSLLLTLQDYLRDREMLLVLDNFEQVTAAAPEVAELLAGTSKLNILVTSRVPLHLRGEHEFAVQPLALPDCQHLPALAVLSQYAAVRLFIERARAVKSDFAVNNDNAPAVAEICVRLDGLPLAIELAAARVKLLSPQAMLVRLEDPLKFLTGGARELTARQQTLRGAIAWSHDLLDENEQRLFRRLGVFAGGCTLESVEAVCNAKGDLGVDVLEGIASLVDKSLLKQIDGPDGEPRFFMLETIREYALERLTESGENEELQRQHVDYFLSFAEQAEIGFRGFQQRKWFEQLGAELNNLRAALDWLTRSNETQNGLRLAGALSEFWWISGHLGEASKTFDLLFALPDASQPTAARAKALMAAARIKAYSDRKKTILWYEESIQIYRELGDQGGLAMAIGNLGFHRTQGGEPARGRPLLEQSVIMFRELGDRWGLAIALSWLGECAHFRGEIIAGGEASEESFRLCREMGNGFLITFALAVLGSVKRMQGEPENARLLFEEGLAAAQEAKFVGEIASRLSNLAQLAFRIGDYSRVADLARASIEKFEEAGSQKQWIGESQFLLGELARRQGDNDQARTHYYDFVATSKASGEENLIAAAFTRLGQVALESDHLDEARRNYNESMAIQRKLGAKAGIAQSLKLFGDLAQVEGKRDEADRFYAESEVLGPVNTIAGPQRPGRSERRP
jgi:predicted ATPase/class 3 adenylate cyclase